MKDWYFVAFAKHDIVLLIMLQYLRINKTRDQSDHSAEHLLQYLEGVGKYRLHYNNITI